MKIGTVAASTDLSVDTIRYYERRGLIDAPARRPSGYRDYAPSVVDRLLTIRSLQELGLTLDEIADMLADHDAGEATCDNQRWRLDAVVERIDARISGLTALRATITDRRAACEQGTCRLLEPPTAR